MGLGRTVRGCSSGTVDDFPKREWWFDQPLWDEGGSCGVSFLEAGRLTSVSPVVRLEHLEDEVEDGEVDGEVGERYLRWMVLRVRVQCVGQKVSEMRTTLGRAKNCASTITFRYHATK